MDELSCGDCCLFQKINWRQIIWKYLIPPVDLSKSSKNSHRLNKFTHGVEFTPTVLAMLSDTVALALCVSSSVFPEDRFARLQMMGTKGKYAHLAHCFVWAHRKKKKILPAPFFFSTIQLAKYASSLLIANNQQPLAASLFCRSAPLQQVFIRRSSGRCRCPALLKTSPGISWSCHSRDAALHTHTRASSALCFCVLVTQKVTWSQVFVAKSVVRVLTSAQKHILVLTLAACRMLTFVDVFCSGGRSTLWSSQIRPMWFAVTCGDKAMTEWWWWRWWRGLLSVHVISWHFLRCISALIRRSSGPSHSVSPLF